MSLKLSVRPVETDPNVLHKEHQQPGGQARAVTWLKLAADSLLNKADTPAAGFKQKWSFQSQKGSTAPATTNSEVPHPGDFLLLLPKCTWI